MVDPDLVLFLAAASRDAHRVRFDYTDHDHRITRRDVEPYRVVQLGGRWCLAAVDPDRDNWRSCRLDRLEVKRPVGARFTPRVASEPAALLTSIEAVFHRCRAVVVIAAPAAEIASGIPTSVPVEAIDAEHCRLFASGETPYNVAMNLLRLDRDFAVEKASAEDVPPFAQSADVHSIPVMTISSTAAFRERAERFTAIVDAASGRWEAPSPCESWTVRDVVAHVIETEREFLQRHDLLSSPAPGLDDPASAWRSHAAEVLEVLSRNGVADRAFDGYFGPTTVGETLAQFYGWDLAVHGWDVARASGQAWPLSDDEARTLGADADGWGDTLYSQGICAAPVPVPDDASPGDRLLGRLGRNPQWTAPQA